MKKMLIKYLKWWMPIEGTVFFNKEKDFYDWLIAETVNIVIIAAVILITIGLTK